MLVPVPAEGCEKRETGCWHLQLKTTVSTGNRNYNQLFSLHRNCVMVSMIKKKKKKQLPCCVHINVIKQQLFRGIYALCKNTAASNILLKSVRITVFTNTVSVICKLSKKLQFFKNIMWNNRR